MSISAKPNAMKHVSIAEVRKEKDRMSTHTGMVIMQKVIRNNYELCTMNYELKETSGGYCGGVPPLPIPNREVKPTYADGTAMQCGRVGSRLLFKKRSLENNCSRGFFVVCI